MELAGSSAHVPCGPSIQEVKLLLFLQGKLRLKEATCAQSSRFRPQTW